MILKNRTLQRMVVVATALLGPMGIAAEPEKGKSPEKILAIPSSAATIERIMEQATRNIARRYNLNEEQTQKTDALMKREVRKFLEEHEDEVWPVIRDLLSAQLGAKPPTDRDEVARIGKAARPLTGLAREAIYRANEEWRLVLTPEQKKMHDFDLAEMGKTFELIDKNFETWEKGEPADQGIFPPQDPQLAKRSPPTPHKPPKGVLKDPVKLIFDHTLFDAFVEQFIVDYALAKGQIDSARSILKEYKEKAKDFMTANRVAFSKILFAQEQAIRARNREKIARAETLRKELLKPVYRLFDEMVERLTGLLSTGQREQYALRNKGPAPKSAKKAAVVEKAPVEKAAAQKTPPKKSPADKTVAADVETGSAKADADQGSR